ncbi:hypothetical protein [Nonomuraea sp. SYSU D8015]|uniref:hypothetical protein n=1 Tax=Nonomuraea sp. SYSU D8015 TaxID=2593644 RepID=UPI001661214B|nr:hypothetical protein [Nonomuraea sp. SYSU D8015]
MSQPRSSKRTREVKPPRNHIAEWFGHRIYPVVADTEMSLSDQQDGRCPFISAATGETHECIKNDQSKGVCTISTSGPAGRRDWLACPFRVLEPGLLDDAARRLFGHQPGDQITLVPATVLADSARANQFRDAVRGGSPCMVYFQNKLGGEISLSATERSPEFSFDSTMVEVLPADNDGFQLGRYGVFEIQTMDFHGSYSHAVRDLSDALRLHKQKFGAAVRDNPEWPGNKIEGPNIANVFKRTFYQMMFKFQVGAHPHSAGCVFAIPAAVWESWQRHLGRPDLIQKPDGTYRLAVQDQEEQEHPSSWIYVFEIVESDTVTPNEIELVKVIGTDAAALSHYALDVAPAAALEEGGSADRILDTLRSRLGEYLVEFAPTPAARGRRRTQEAAELPGLLDLPELGDAWPN